MYLVIPANKNMAVTHAIFESQAKDMLRLPHDFEREEETQTSERCHRFFFWKRSKSLRSLGEKNSEA